MNWDEESIRKEIKEKQNLFQLLAPLSEIHIKANFSKTEKDDLIIFGKYNSEKTRSYPFYKPYSKIIDLNKRF